MKFHFEECLHADHINLPVPLSDSQIWNFALENKCIIVTNDEDFMHFSNVKGFPPKVILLKTGNQSNQFIKELLIRRKEAIQDFAMTKEYGILELF